MTTGISGFNLAPVQLPQWLREALQGHVPAPGLSHLAGAIGASTGSRIISNHLGLSGFLYPLFHRSLWGTPRLLWLPAHGFKWKTKAGYSNQNKSGCATYFTLLKVYLTKCMFKPPFKNCFQCNVKPFRCVQWMYRFYLRRFGSWHTTNSLQN